MSIIHRHIILIGQTTINIEYGISNIIYSLSDFNTEYKPYIT